MRSEENTEETRSVKIDTSALPPHLVLEMPALSPTMVRREGLRNGLGFLLSFSSFL